MAGTVNLKHTGAQIDKAIDDVSSLLTQLGGINETDYNKLDTTVKTLSANSASYSTNIQNISTDIAKINGELGNLGASLTKASGRIDEVEGKQTSYDSGLSQKVEVEAYNKKMTLLDNKDIELEKRIETLQESSNNGYNNLSIRIDANANSIATNTDNLDKLTKVFGGTEEATALVEKINKLNFDTIDGLTTNVDNIINEIDGDSGIKAKITTIENTYATKAEIPTDYATLEQLGNYMLATDIQSLVNQLSTRIDTLEETNTTLENTIADLQKQIDTLKGEINNANSGQ